MVRKRVVTPAPSDCLSWDDVDANLAAIAEIDRELTLLETEQAARIDRFKADVKAEADPLRDKKAELEAAMQRYAEANRSEFRDSKTKQLTFGSVGFRVSHKIVFKRGADVVAALEGLGLINCLRVKKEADKEAMRALPLETLAEVGADLRTENTFGYVIAKEELPPT